jgi:hypothetical protein
MILYINLTHLSYFVSEEVWTIYIKKLQAYNLEDFYTIIAITQKVNIESYHLLVAIEFYVLFNDLAFFDCLYFHSGIPCHQIGLAISHSGIPCHQTGLAISHSGIPCHQTGLAISHSGIPCHQIGLAISHSGIPHHQIDLVLGSLPYQHSFQMSLSSAAINRKSISETV